MKISIITAYYNRRQLLINTLKSIVNSKIQPFEFIVVDDGSDLEHRINDLQENYSFLKVIEINKNEKTYINPCIPYNKAIKAASGDIIIIQNPECFHVGDILSYVTENIKDDNYLVFSCYSLTKAQTNKLTEAVNRNSDFNLPILRVVPVKDGEEGWYQHSVLNCRNLHFCAAITKKNLDSIGGFDEIYASGIRYDDDEFLYRLKKQIKTIENINEPFVYHQYHYNESQCLKTETQKKKMELINKNQNLFYRYTLTNLYKAKTTRKFAQKYINKEKLSIKEIILIERIILKSIKTNINNNVLEYQSELEFIWKELLLTNIKTLGFKSCWIYLRSNIKKYIPLKVRFILKLLIKVVLDWTFSLVCAVNALFKKYQNLS